jgi:hypothetical protein
LSFDWLNANFFRRGVSPGVEALSECREDRNPLNTNLGIIKYGPLTQIDGPNARFYQAQSTATGAATGSVTFPLIWKAILDSGEPYSVNFKVQATFTQDQIEYVFSNVEAPVEVQWPQVLTPPVLSAAQRLNQPVRDGRIVLAGPQPVRFSFGGVGIRRQRAPLSVYIPNGPLLYRDVFTGLTFEVVR